MQIGYKHFQWPKFRNKICYRQRLRRQQGQSIERKGFDSIIQELTFQLRRYFQKMERH